MAASQVVLYDATGTEVPLLGKPTPPSFRVTPDGVEQSYRDRFRGYPSRNLTPSKIVNILQQADAGSPLEWIELCEEIVEKDPKIASVLHTRTAAILGLYYEVQPPKLATSNAPDDELSQEIARFVDEALLSCNYHELVGDLMDAVGKPFAVDWIDWDEDKFTPRRFNRIPTSHIHWSHDSDTIRVFDPHNPKPRSDGNMGTVFEPLSTVRALYNTRHDHPTRSGLLRSLVWYFHFKTTGLKDLAAYVDRYGMPMRIIKLDVADFENPEIFERYQNALRSMGSDASGILSKNSDIDIKPTGTQDGTSVFSVLIDYIDKSIAQLVLGHELSSQGSAGGGMLGISAALQVRQDILEADCNFISSVVKRDVLMPMVAWNFGWENVHLTPNITYNYEPPKDLIAASSVLRNVSAVFGDNLTFSKQQIRDEYGYDEPLGEEDESDDPESDVLTPRAISSPQEGQGQDPNEPPLLTPADVTVNTLAARPNPPTRYTKSRQKKVDRLADKGLTAATAMLAKWEKQLKAMAVQAMENGESLYDLRRRIVKSYPDLDAKSLDSALREVAILARLFGRNS